MSFIGEWVISLVFLFGKIPINTHVKIESRGKNQESREKIRIFWLKHGDSEQALKAWYQEAERSNWQHPNDIKAEYPSASILGDNRIVFNIKGNNYRLIVKINYAYQMCWIRFVGTHAEYDKINATTI